MIGESVEDVASFSYPVLKVISELLWLENEDHTIGCARILDLVAADLENAIKNPQKGETWQCRQ